MGEHSLAVFDQFRAVYGPLRDMAVGAPWPVDGLLAVDGYAAFAREFAGTTFSGGLYRIHDSVSGPRAVEALASAFPEYSGAATPFGFDWLGRQFAVTHSRLPSGVASVLIFEPGTGEVLDTEAGLVEFHDSQLTQDPDAALAVEFFKEWFAQNPTTVPLPRNFCVGYRTPLFLGGDDTVSNLELSDIDVYWSICAQLLQRIAGGGLGA